MHALYKTLLPSHHFSLLYHSTIFETEFLVDLQKIQEENFKLTVLQDYNTTTSAAHRSRAPRNNPFGKSRDSGGSNSIHNSSHGGMTAHPHDSTHGAHSVHNGGNSSHGSADTNSSGNNNSAVSGLTGSLSTYSRSQGQQRIVR